MLGVIRPSDGMERVVDMAAVCRWLGLRVGVGGEGGEDAEVVRSHLGGTRGLLCLLLLLVRSLVGFACRSLHYTHLAFGHAGIVTVAIGLARTRCCVFTAIRSPGALHWVMDYGFLVLYLLFGFIYFTG
jgi:hypothetical protein